jgi:hypothetical protein
MNLEWLKNINSLLSQVIELSESEFSAGKWLDLATNAAKQLSNFSSNPFSPLSSQGDPVSERQSGPISSSENTGPGMNLMDLWKSLNPANKLLQQISDVGPILQAFMNPKDEKPANQRITASPNLGGGFFIKKTVLNLLVFALLPVLLMNFILRFR